MKKERIVFLDFDGVVNTPIWEKKIGSDRTEHFVCRYAWPNDGYVNNYQAVCWLNELYRKCPFDIVITSSWREWNYEDGYNSERCLRKGGLLDSIKVIGELKPGSKRESLIKIWIKEHNFEGDFIIFDDESSYYHEDYRKNYLVLTDPSIGINYKEYSRAKYLFTHTITELIDDKLEHHQPADDLWD